LDDDGTRGFGGGGGCDAERTRPSITAARALCAADSICSADRRKIEFFKARQESNVFYIFTKSSSRAEKPRLMLSHFALHRVWSEFGNSSSWKRVEITSPER